MLYLYYVNDYLHQQFRSLFDKFLTKKGVGDLLSKLFRVYLIRVYLIKLFRINFTSKNLESRISSISFASTNVYTIQQ